jgi:sodium-coupled neutral amino acid transporter 4
MKGQGGVFRELAQLAGNDNLPPIILNKWFVVFIPAIALVLPFLFLKKIDRLSFIGTVGTFLIALYLVHSIVYLGIGVHNEGFDPNHEIKWFTFNRYIITALSIQAFAFHCHPIIGPAIERLKNPTRVRQYILMGLVLIGAGIAYFVGGLLPYLTLFEKIEEPMIFSFYPVGQMFTIITKALYALFLIISNPQLLFSIRKETIRMIFRREIGYWPYVGIGIALMTLACILACAVDSIGVMFDFIGGVGCTLLIYILPAIFYLRICKGEGKFKMIIAWIMIPVGSASLIVSLYSAIDGLVHG